MWSQVIIFAFALSVTVTPGLGATLPSDSDDGAKPERNYTGTASAVTLTDILKGLNISNPLEVAEKKIQQHVQNFEDAVNTQTNNFQRAAESGLEKVSEQAESGAKGVGRFWKNLRSQFLERKSQVSAGVNTGVTNIKNFYNGNEVQAVRKDLNALYNSSASAVQRGIQDLHLTNENKDGILDRAMDTISTTFEKRRASFSSAFNDLKQKVSNTADQVQAKLSSSEVQSQFQSYLDNLEAQSQKLLNNIGQMLSPVNGSLSNSTESDEADDSNIVN